MLKTNPKMVKDFFETSQQNIVIDTNRKNLLLKIANEIAANYNNENVNINFICTHNSRRSQLGQVWSFYAADYFNLPISAFSGGTEVTAFHRNTVKTLTDVGFKFDIDVFSHTNPTYRISKVVFIHGVGEGVLKSELHYLFSRYPVRFYDASFKKYGLGATEVYIYQNPKS